MNPDKYPDGYLCQCEPGFTSKGNNNQCKGTLKTWMSIVLKIHEFKCLVSFGAF